MKQKPDMDKVQAQMATGRLSREGFLGQDERKLVDILAEDYETVTALGFTHEKIAEILKTITWEGKKNFGSPVQYKDSWVVVVEDSRGVMACPFGHKGMYPKENVTVKNEKTGEKVRWTALNIHMICEHGFYEGKGSLFRVEPRDIIRVLEMNQDGSI